MVLSKNDINKEIEAPKTSNLLNINNKITFKIAAKRVVYKGMEDYEPMKYEPWEFKVTTKDGKELSFDINQLEQLAKEVIGIIPKEVEVRNIILEEIKELGITDNAYSVANDLLKNNEMIEFSSL